MFKIQLKIAWRNLKKQPGFAVINIFGLAIGLAASMLISLYVLHELSFDRFNEKANRIYRVDNIIKVGGNYMDLAVSGPLFGITAKREYPQIEQMTRLNWYGSLYVKKGNENIKEENVAWADSTLFEVFTLPMVSGDPKTALTEPNSMVITETLAKKYFGTSDAAGKTLLINNKETRKVTGVIKDVPSNCHFQFEVFLPLVENKNATADSWVGEQNWNNYLVFKEGVKAQDMLPRLQEMLDRRMEPQLFEAVQKTLDDFQKEGNYFKVMLTALPDIHLHSNKTGELYGSGDIQYVYIFSAIALFILLIACVNFTNLSTARSATRSGEVGVRKVLGSKKSGLVYGFLSEAFLTALFAMIAAYWLAWLSLPYFNKLTGKTIDHSVFYQSSTLVWLLALSVLVGLLAGIYPSFYLSSFQPIRVLKGNLSAKSQKSNFRNGLVVFQFASSVILIVFTVGVYRQLDFIRKKDLGYNRDQMLVIKNTGSLGDKAPAFKNELLQLASVKNATLSPFLPVNHNRSNDSYFPNPSLDTKEAILMQNWNIDENYIPTLDIKIVAGRNFSKDMGTDSLGLILNESAAKFLGANGALHKKLYRIADPEAKKVDEYHIIGIVKDFHFSSLKEGVKPLAFLYSNDPGSITLKVQSSDLQALIGQVRSKFEALAPEQTFEYSFMDDDFNKQYEGDKKVGILFSVFAVLTILIACLGLFGLAAYMAEQRTKEIGIRKVLGASVAGITSLLAKDFLKLVLIAIVIASPLAYYFMQKWLSDFAYRIDIQWWMFVAAGAAAVVIAFLTVGFQSVKAALANPVRSLRNE